MPPTRNVPASRSRRLSRQAPMNYNEDAFYGYGNGVHILDDKSRYPSESASTVTSVSNSPSSFPSSLPFSDSDTSYPIFPAQLQLSSRSPHARGRPENHIPRPPNAFICFRSAYWLAQKENPTETDHREVSRSAGKQWRLLTAAQRAPWEKMARDLKKQHAEKYPDYKYTPSAQKRVAAKKIESKDVTKAEVERCEELAKRLVHGERLEDFVAEEKHEVESAGTASVPVAGAPSSSSSETEAARDHSIPALSEPAPVHDATLSLLPCDPCNPFDDEATPKPSFTMTDAISHNLSGPYLDFEPQEVPEFVPTSEIPSIESEMSTLKINEEYLEKSPSPPPFFRIDPQFGFKPRIMPVDAFLPTMPDYTGASSDLLSLSSSLSNECPHYYSGQDFEPTSLSEMTAAGSNTQGILPLPSLCSLWGEDVKVPFGSLSKDYTMSGSSDTGRTHSAAPPSPICDSAGKDMWKFVDFRDAL